MHNPSVSIRTREVLECLADEHGWLCDECLLAAMGHAFSDYSHLPLELNPDYCEVVARQRKNQKETAAWMDRLHRGVWLVKIDAVTGKVTEHR